MYAFTLTPAGRELEHSGKPLFSILYLPFAKIKPISSPNKDLGLKDEVYFFFDIRSYPHL